MGSHSKREQRIRRNRRTVRLEELLALLRGEGFECRLGGSHHWSCRHRTGAWCNVPEAHGRGDRFVLQPYVNRALEALDEARAAQQPAADEEGDA